jgi:hypothetical protein
MKLTRSAIEAWNRFWFDPGPATRLGLARAVFCLVAFLFYLPHDFSEWATAAPFWMPIWLFDNLQLPVLSMTSLAVAQSIWKVSLALTGLGLFTRASNIVAAVLGTYLLGLPHNFGATQHYDTLVVFALWVLAFSRAGDTYSVDALRMRAQHRRPRPMFDAEYSWPIRAMWVLIALMFFGAGTSKLRHSGIEWALSNNMQLLLVRAYYHVSDGDPLTSLGLTVARYSWLSRAIACGALGLESLYLVTLFSRRLRPYVGIGGMFFFVGIRALMGPTFEPYLVCGLLLIPWHRVEAAVLRVLYNARTYAPHAACDPAGAGHVPTAAASGSSVRSAAGH